MGPDYFVLIASQITLWLSKGFFLLTKIKVHNMKSNCLKFTFLLCILLVCYSSIYSQQDSLRKSDNNYKMNLIHGSFGTLVLGYTANIFYDRLLSRIGKQNSTCTFVRIGYQDNIILTDPNGSAFILEGGILTGKNYGHFEGALGITYIQTQNNVIRPAFSVGFRGQKPNGTFMFRTGLGFPELLFLGVGIGF